MMMKGKQRKDRDRRRVVQGVACAILAVVFLAVVFWPSERKDASRPKAENQPLRYAGASRVVEKDSEEELKEPPKGALAELKEHIKTAEPPRYAFPNEPPTTKERSDEEESANESQQKVSSKDKKALNIVPIPRFKAGELSVHDFFAQNEVRIDQPLIENEVWLTEFFDFFVDDQNTHTHTNNINHNHDNHNRGSCQLSLKARCLTTWLLR